MPYNNELDLRVRNITRQWRNITTRKMFGGVGYMLNGNIICGVYKDFLILRLGINEFESALRSPFVKPFDITGKPMKGWIMVQNKGLKNDEVLSAWLEQAKKFVKTLPGK